MDYMLRRCVKLLDSRMEATDGMIGKLYDLYFDDRSMRFRYAVIDTGHWLPGRRVLIPIESLGMPYYNRPIVRVNLTKDEIRNAPDWNSTKPVYRENMVELSFVVPPLCGSPDLGLIALPSTHSQEEPDGENHLRSLKEVRRYAIAGPDGTLGTVADFVIRSDKWTLAYILAQPVDTGRSKTAMIEIAELRMIKWEQKTILVNTSKQDLLRCPYFVSPVAAG